MAHEFLIKTTSGELVTYTDYDAIDLTTLKHVIKFLPDLGLLVGSHEILLESGTVLETTGGEITASFTGDSFVVISTAGTLLVNLFVENTADTVAGIEDIKLTNSSGTVVRIVQGLLETDSNAVSFAIKDSDGNVLRQYYLSNTSPGLSTETTTFTSEIVTGPAVDRFITEGSMSTIEVELETGDGGLLLETGGDVRFENFTFSDLKTLTAGEPIVLENGVDRLVMETPDGRDKLVPENFADGLENHLVLETSPDDVPDNHYHAPTGAPHRAGDGHTPEEHREIALWDHKLSLLMERERLNNASS